jgi:hypothetical protein
VLFAFFSNRLDYVTKVEGFSSGVTYPGDLDHVTRLRSNLSYDWISAEKERKLFFGRAKSREDLLFLIVSQDFMFRN